MATSVLVFLALVRPGLGVHASRREIKEALEYQNENFEDVFNQLGELGDNGGAADDFVEVRPLTNKILLSWNKGFLSSRHKTHRNRRHARHARHTKTKNKETNQVTNRKKT